jgi:hypothetical protein
MSFLDKLERRFGRIAVPNLSLLIVIGQVFVLLSALLGRLDPGYFVLVPGLVLHGQWWRLFTFILLPPPPGLFGYLFVAFAWYIFYLMGNALEGYWGVFRYNLFLFVGYAFTVGVAFLTPAQATTNLFIAGSVFLAFAWLNPDFELAIFFILPVKIKWLALVTWLADAYYCFVGDWSLRLQILASVANFLLFFAHDIFLTMRHRKRAMARQAQGLVRSAEESEPRHRCHVCGKDSNRFPRLDFRYCSKCAGDQCYCPEHIGNHVHVLTTDEPPQG